MERDSCVLLVHHKAQEKPLFPLTLMLCKIVCLNGRSSKLCCWATVNKGFKGTTPLKTAFVRQVEEIKININFEMPSSSLKWPYSHGVVHKAQAMLQDAAAHWSNCDT